jgi:hypothetical protein
MSRTNNKGDISEVAIMLDLIDKGYKVSIPYGHDCIYDLIVDRGNKLEKIQVKTATKDKNGLRIRCRYRVGNIKSAKYTKEDIDWIAAYDLSSKSCHYIPAEKLGDGRVTISLRTSGKWKNCLQANDFLEF